MLFRSNLNISTDFLINKKIRADIQIQLDILEFINNGGIIKYNDNTTGRLNSKSLKGARAGKRLYNKFN